MNFYIVFDEFDRDKGIFRGRLTDQRREDVPFSSLSRLLVIMDALMDCPTMWQVPKREGEKVYPDLCINVLNRVQGAWQGKIAVPGRKREIPFCSVLDLIIKIETTV